MCVCVHSRPLYRSLYLCVVSMCRLRMTSEPVSVLMSVELIMAMMKMMMMMMFTVDTASLMSEVSLGHIDTCGTQRVCLHATLTGGHLGGFTYDTPSWQTHTQPHTHTHTHSAP